MHCIISTVVVAFEINYLYLYLSLNTCPNQSTHYFSCTLVCNLLSTPLWFASLNSLPDSGWSRTIKATARPRIETCYITFLLSTNLANLTLAQMKCNQTCTNGEFLDRWNGQT